MPRKVGWTDKSITGGRGVDKDKRFKGQKGMTFVIRVMTDCDEFRTHFVDDVLEPDKDGEVRGFSVVCAKTWDEDADDYVGDCLCCERDYDVSTQYIAGVILVGQYKGRAKKPQELDAESSVLYWQFGADKYRKLSDIALELSRATNARKLHQVELTVKCEDDFYQKLNLNVSQADRLTTKEHIVAWKDEGEDLVASACKVPSSAEMKRSLKKKKGKKSSRDEDLDLDGDGDEGEKPRRSAKKTKTKGKGKKDPEPEGDGDDESTGDGDLDDLLDEL